MDAVISKVGEYGFFIGFSGECGVTKEFQEVTLESDTYGVKITYTGGQDDNGFVMSQKGQKQLPATENFQTTGVAFAFGSEQVSLQVKGG